MTQNIPIPQKGSSSTLRPQPEFVIIRDGEQGTEPLRVSSRDTDEFVGESDEKSASLLWAVLASVLPNDEKSIQRMFVTHAEYDLALTHQIIKDAPRDQFYSLALTLRDRLIERWKDTELYFDRKGVKKVYYLSLEFLLGRSLQNGLHNLNLQDNFSRALRNLGVIMENLYDEETDAGLGNGGLGRLAACFLDSLATLNYPAWGYGLRYQYGIFHQLIQNGYQVEVPDFWLRYGNPWEIARNDVQFPVQFYGTVVKSQDANSEDGFQYRLEGGEQVMAVAYDMPVPGYATYNANNLRLWSARPSKEFDFALFNRGDYFAAVENRQRSETITSVLYPNDSTSVGKELRLKQQYFFVSATIQDILLKFDQSEAGLPITELPNKVAIQLNDTHPALAIAELMRILVDIKKVRWSTAWDITRKVFAYTNHTVLPEALEKWEVAMMEHLLPRILLIIYNINHFFLLDVEKMFPPDQVVDMKRKLSLIQEDPVKRVRMAHLAIVGSHHINGVAALHSELLKTHVFPEFFKIYPHMFTNVTNGVTPRRWIQQANPHLSSLITDALRTGKWAYHLELLKGLRKYVDNEDFRQRWTKAKSANKKRLAQYIDKHFNMNIPTNALFDIQVKRIHEYKRQLLNILFVVWRYRYIKGLSDDERADVVPRVVIFGGKAAPGYYVAKLIIKLINCVANKINDDSDCEGLLKVIYIPNYNVSLAELLVPASDISQHISTAGMEASGTSNMKFAMNGGLIIGTLDGANVEIRDEIGAENMFIFGTEAENVETERKRVREGKVKMDPRLEEVISMLQGGTFGEFLEVHQLLNSFLHGNDFYLLTVDWNSYLEAQDRVDKTFQDKEKWTKMSILSTAGMGKFSSDRSIHNYAQSIWQLKTCRRHGPVSVDTGALAKNVGSSLARYAATVSPLDALSPLSNVISMERLSPQDQITVQSYSPSSSYY